MGNFFWPLICILHFVMVLFSKPIGSSSEETLPAKQKCTLNSELASEDNVHKDAVKQRKLGTTHSKSGTSKSPNLSFYSATQNPSLWWHPNNTPSAAKPLLRKWMMLPQHKRQQINQQSKPTSKNLLGLGSNWTSHPSPEYWISVTSIKKCQTDRWINHGCFWVDGQRQIYLLASPAYKGWNTVSVFA